MTSDAEFKVQRYSLCRRCREPLVGTLAIRKKEWVCVVCGEFTPFFAGHPSVDATPEIDARFAELEAQWRERNEEIIAAWKERNHG